MVEKGHLPKNNGGIAWESAGILLLGSQLASVVFLSSVLLGCPAESSRVSGSGQEQGANKAPTVRLGRIVPTPILLSDLVSVLVEADDPEGDAVTVRYRWFVNGQLVPRETSEQLPVRLLKRGDQVKAELVPFDGKVEGTPYQTNPVLVGNTLPVLQQVIMEPQHPVPGETLHAKVDVVDADHDSVRLTFRWWKNHTLIKDGEEDAIDTTGLAPKDLIRVEVTPHDRISAGQPVLSQLVIGNRSPEIVSTPSNPTNRDLYEYLVQARDPEGDSISYLLEIAPPGMNIDKNTGHISWKIPAGLIGTHKVRVVAEDGQGGFSSQEFELTLASPAAA